MPIQTVLLIWSNPLFLKSIQLLLKNPEVICVSIAFNVVAVIDDIQRVRPDVVIFEKTENKIPIDVMDIFEGHNRKMRVLELSLADNELSVYQHQQMYIGKAEDLLNFILG